MKNFFNPFKTLQTSFPFSGSIDDVQARLEPQTSFVDSPKLRWTYQWLGKEFNGSFRANQFLMIHVPFPLTRYGTVLQGNLGTKDRDGQSLTLKAWVDPRARRKLILGYSLSAIVIGRLIYDRISSVSLVDTEAVLPFILLASFPMAVLGTTLYCRSRNKAFQRLEELLRSQS